LLQDITSVLRYTLIACFVRFSYIIYILVCKFPDNGSWRMQRVGGNKELKLYAWCICRCWLHKEK